MLRKGFILPNGQILIPNGFNTTHDDIAMDYIKRNVMNQYLKGYITNPSDFLVACGAMRIGCNSNKMIIVSVFNRNPIILEKIDEYEKNNYEIIRVSENLIIFQDSQKYEEKINVYGRTVIQVNGKYIYNPCRIGD